MSVTETRGPLGVTHEDEKTEGWCEIICVIPELKTNKRLSGGKFVDKPTGGKLNCKFSERSLEFDIECTSKQKKQIKYEYIVKKLPGDIVPEDCKTKVKEGKVILQLKKVETRSWQREISANGIDQIQEEDEEPEEK